MLQFDDVFMFLETFRWPFGNIFITFWGFGGQVGSGFEEVEKNVSENQNILYNLIKCDTIQLSFIWFWYSFLYNVGLVAIECLELEADVLRSQVFCCLGGHARTGRAQKEKRN